MTVDQPVRRAHFDRWIAERLPGFVGEIAELVAFDTRSPNEGHAVDWLRDRLTGLDAQVWLEPRHPDMRAATLAGHDVDRRRAWCVSCDARLYHDLLAVPVVVFGAGQLESAHSSAERLELDEFTRGVWALAVFLSRSQVPVG